MGKNLPEDKNGGLGLVNACVLSCSKCNETEYISFHYFSVRKNRILLNERKLTEAS